MSKMLLVWVILSMTLCACQCAGESSLLLDSARESAAGSTVKAGFPLPVLPDDFGQRFIIRLLNHQELPSGFVFTGGGQRSRNNDWSAVKRHERSLAVQHGPRNPSPGALQNAVSKQHDGGLSQNPA
jgi:hypothetical protein